MVHVLLIFNFPPRAHDSRQPLQTSLSYLNVDLSSSCYKSMLFRRRKGGLYFDHERTSEMVSFFGCSENCTNRCPVAFGAGRLMCIIHVFKMHLASCAWLYIVVMCNQSTSHVCKLCHNYYVVYYSPGESTEMHSLCAPNIEVHFIPVVRSDAKEMLKPLLRTPVSSA